MTDRFRRETYLLPQGLLRASFSTGDTIQRDSRQRKSASADSLKNARPTNAVKKRSPEVSGRRTIAACVGLKSTTPGDRYLQMKKHSGFISPKTIDFPDAGDQLAKSSPKTESGSGKSFGVDIHKLGW